MYLDSLVSFLQLFVWNEWVSVVVGLKGILD